MRCDCGQISGYHKTSCILNARSLPDPIDVDFIDLQDIELENYQVVDYLPGILLLIPFSESRRRPRLKVRDVPVGKNKITNW